MRVCCMWLCDTKLKHYTHHTVRMVYGSLKHELMVAAVVYCYAACDAAAGALCALVYVTARRMLSVLPHAVDGFKRSEI